MIQQLRNWFATALVAICIGASGPAIAGPLDVLPGRWSGWGELTMAGGETEKVRCIATYVQGTGDQQLRHNLRCASRSYTIDVLAQIKVSGDRVSGEWVERKYSTRGVIAGSVVGDGLSANIKGQSFEASLKVEATQCNQVVQIAPTGHSVSSIAIRLAKC